MLRDTNKPLVPTRDEWEAYKQTIPQDEILASLHPINAALMVANHSKPTITQDSCVGSLRTKASPLPKP
jgi:hypothetical protein